MQLTMTKNLWLHSCVFLTKFEIFSPGNDGTTGGGTGGRDLDNIENEVNDDDEDEECCLTATRADIIVTHLEILGLLVILSTILIISENKI